MPVFEPLKIPEPEELEKPYPNFLLVRSIGSTCGLSIHYLTLALYSGSSFKGFQKSGKNSYAVSVDLQYVDLSSSFLCGYLRIAGLTEDWFLNLIEYQA